MHAPLVFSLVFSLAAAVSAHMHGQLTRRHLNRRSENATTALDKRIDNARFSYYEAGLGACGQVNSGSDFIVALNSDQYDSGNYCFQMITITCLGKTTQAQITDRCPGCPYGGLDFSEGLFEFFSSTDAGIIYGTWDFGNGGPPVTTTQEQPPPPSSTSVASSTSTQASMTTSGSSSHSSTSPTATSVSPTDSASATASGVPPPSAQEVGGTVEQVYLAVMALGGLVRSAT